MCAVSEVRASDREREAATLRLRAAHLEGRVEVDELERRLERAHAAVTVRDLDAVLDDLPDRPHVKVDETTGVPRWPGRRAFSERKLIEVPPGDVREAALAYIVPSLERWRFVLTADAGDTLVFDGPGRDRLTVRLRPAPDHRTLVIAHGVAPLRVRKAFATLTT
jgi:hypothetical protein